MAQQPITFDELNTLTGINTQTTIQAQLDSKDTDSLSTNKILVGDAGGLSAAVDMSGGATIVSSGVVTLGGKMGYTTTATAAGTTVLTATSTVLQFFTGVTTQTVTLPVVSTLALGWQFTVVNLSTGAVTVNSSGANLVATVAASSRATFTCILITGTDAASWSATTSPLTGFVSPTWTTFTPTVTLVGGAGNTVPVYTTNSGRYSTAGKIVTAEVLLTGDGGAEGAGSGVLSIALPVAAGASALAGKFPVGYGLNNTLESILYGTIGAGATVIGLSYFDAIGTTAAYTGDQQNNATRTIRLNFTYEGA